MSFRDVKKFCFKLLDDLTLSLTGKEVDESILNKKKKMDDEDVSNLIANVLRNKPNLTKIIVIDEIDTFEAYEKAFLTLTKAILSSKSNTILIGIANSVDLPFKKKHSAIAMRDTQLLFEPYNDEQIIDILEKKINMKYHYLPQNFKSSKLIKTTLFSIVDEKAKLVIAKKVARMNGDLRVAFDIIRSCFVTLQNKVLIEDLLTNIQVSLAMV